MVHMHPLIHVFEIEETIDGKRITFEFRIRRSDAGVYYCNTYVFPIPYDLSIPANSDLAEFIYSCFLGVKSFKDDEYAHLQ